MPHALWAQTLLLSSPLPLMQPQLTAVALIRLVITVGIPITAPACVDAEATVTHEFPRAAGLVGSWKQR